MKKRTLSILLVLALLCAMLPVSSVLAADTETVAYPVEGGNIYFDPATGTIVSCDINVRSADIPAEIDGTPVTGIGYFAFAGSKLYRVSIPSSVTSIGDDVFQNCNNLSSIDIPSSVTSIGQNVFWGCYSLTQINVEEGSANYYSIDGVLFDKERKCLIQYPIGKDDIVYNVPAGVDSIEHEAFANCSNLTSVSISSGVTSIGSSAFSNCSNLSSVDIPSGMISIEGSAFGICISLSSLSIPSSVTNIGFGAFNGCSGLTQINVEEGNQNYCSIDGILFDKEMETLIQFPSSKNDTVYVVPEGVIRIEDWAFDYCGSLTSVDIPDSVTYIGRWGFNHCSSLVSIDIPSGVTYIEPYTFHDCSSLTSVSIPVGVTNIAWSAFGGCDSLTDVYYGGTRENWGEIRIESMNEELLNATIHYVDGSSSGGNNGTISFTDVPNGKFYTEAVKWAVENGVTTGKTATTFVPDGICNRGEIVTFLWRAAGKQEPTTAKTSFTDVEKGKFYYTPVLWAVEKKITTGVNNTTFGPGQNCTRGQIVTFLWRAAGSPEPKATKTTFTDVKPGSYCDKAVRWAVENGITNGKTATTFVPEGTCTRGEAVTFLYRARNLLK